MGSLSGIMNRIGLSALTIAMLCGTSGCAVFGPQKTDAQRQLDRETADRVTSALNSDGELYARHITVRADGGTVSLGGFVWTRPDLDEAIRVASDVPGVTRVVNDLELERNGIDDSPVSR